MKARTLKGRTVVCLPQAKKLGVVNDILVDRAISRVVGLKLQTGRRGTGYIVRANDIRCIGTNAVVITDGMARRDEAVPDLRALPTGQDLHHTKVITYSGTVLGRRCEVEFDPTQHHITQYLLAGSLWNPFARTTPLA